MNMPKTKDAMIKFFNCPLSDTDVLRFENDGGSGTEGRHTESEMFPVNSTNCAGILKLNNSSMT